MRIELRAELLSQRPNKLPSVKQLLASATGVPPGVRRLCIIFRRGSCISFYKAARQANPSRRQTNTTRKDVYTTRLPETQGAAARPRKPGQGVRTTANQHVKKNPIQTRIRGSSAFSGLFFVFRPIWAFSIPIPSTRVRFFRAAPPTSCFVKPSPRRRPWSLGSSTPWFPWTSSNRRPWTRPGPTPAFLRPRCKTPSACSNATRRTSKACWSWRTASSSTASTRLNFPKY